MFWKIKWFGIVILSVLILTPSSAWSDDSVRIGTWKTPQTIQPFFYENYLPSTMKVSVLPFTNPADQKTALLAKSLDMCGTTLAHAIYSASVGQPIVVVAALCNRCSALVVKKDGSIKSEKELAGKTIGYVPGTMHEILLRETLIRNGISPAKDVTLMRVDFFDMGTALAGGVIDAFLSGEPFPSLAVHQGYGRILSYPYYDESIGTINAGMLVLRESIEESPDKVFELVLAHARATQYLKTDRKAWLDRAQRFGTPREVLERAASNMELAWEMDAAFVKRAKALGDRMQALNMISQQPDYNRLFDLSFVKRARKTVQ